MIFAQMSGSQTLLVAVGLLAVILLTRGRIGRRRGRPQSATGRELHDAEHQSALRVHALEVRLHDYGREVEGRITTNLALLDQLITEADREIVRLETLLDNARRVPSSDEAATIPLSAAGVRESLNAEQRQMIRLLSQSGYTADEIAQLVDRTADEVRGVLNDTTYPRRADAA